MLAVGTSMEDAKMLCELDDFAGRIDVAASNSSSSVTISGDEDAIAELQVILDDERKFNRRLKVDRAYHSKHMVPCFEPYVKSLRHCGVKAQKPSGQCTWFSSVYERAIDSEFGLSDTYWGENMMRPVLFFQALNRALSAAKPDIVLEIGPHPALKGPASQTIQEILNQVIPYQGVLTRGTDAVEASSICLGFLWSYLDKGSINLDEYEQTLTGVQHSNVVKNLPSYKWNHGVKYWHESRISRKIRHRQSPVHSLLGEMTPDCAPHHLSWRHLLRASEIDWLDGHRVQNQIVYPAAGYTSAALEASRFLADEGKDICLIEIKDFFIHQAIAFDEEDSGIEVLIELAEITRHPSSDSVRAKWTYSAALGAQAEDLTLAASGEVEVFLGEPSPWLLPKRRPPLPHLVDVETDRLYSSLADLGYNFSGRFRSLTSLKRRFGKASGIVQTAPHKAGEEPLLSHPTELDSAYQSLILAYTFPGDDQLWSLHLPTSIRKIRVNPALCTSESKDVEFAPVDATLIPTGAKGRGITGDIDIYSNDCPNAAIQVQGLRLVPLGGSATAADDRRIFSRMSWVDSSPDGKVAAKDTPVTESDLEFLGVLERISTYYLRQFDQDVPLDDPYRSERPYSCYLNYARHMTSLVETGQHRNAKQEWMRDTLDDIMEASKKYVHLCSQPEGHKTINVCTH
jgi:acyl transferase domain-containing protein